MPNQKIPTPDPDRDPTNPIERAPGRNEDANDKDTPSPERHRDPLKQPGEVPDVKPDVIARKPGSGQGQGAGQGTGPAQRRKQ
ncbi:MAG TPA: hypothetical protein VLD36_22785 [Burkholderiales bacterium]|jgi:hypothetical protein|nr:hypothetical protein [Burkholderiales bacterium]